MRMSLLSSAANITKLSSSKLSTIYTSSSLLFTRGWSLPCRVVSLSFMLMNLFQMASSVQLF